MTDRKFWFWLNNIEGIGNTKIRILLESFHTPMNIYYADKSLLESIPGITPKDVENIWNKDNKKHLEELYIRCEEKGIKDWSTIKSALKDGLRDYVFAKTKRNPMILPIIMEV